MRIRLPVLLALLWLCAFGAQAETPLPHRAHGMSVGTVNCSSSTCHGSVRPWEGSHVLQNEYTTWLRLDPHAKARDVLLSPASARIAKNLGLRESAENAQVCLDCHSHNPSGPRGERFQITEGVSCEGCHGPAGDWIGSHTESGATHAGNIAKGLYPTDEPLARARLCLSCHLGDATRPMTHRIMGAGHPRLSFELRTFVALEPAHYRVDADYRERKGAPDALATWAVGQAVAAQGILAIVSDPARRDGLFPELVAFDCHACHHPMSEQRWSPRLGIGPGRVRVNDSHLLMLRAVVRATLPSRSADFDAAVRAMHRGVSTGELPPGKSATDVVRELSARIDELVPALAASRYDAATMRAILAALVDEATAPVYADYAGAEQAVMAINGLAMDLRARGALPTDAAMDAALARLLAVLAHEEHYSPGNFSRALAALRASLRTDAGRS